MNALASLKLTAAAIALFAAGIAGSYMAPEPALWAIAAPLVLLAANLVAAIARHPTFRRQAALLAFHLALAALALLAAAGQLTSLKGRVELTAGEAFAGGLLQAEKGPLHLERLQRVWFVNEGFEIDYAAKLKRGETRNTVRWRDETGAERVSVIGDQTPLVVHGYRFYTTPNKGFAPLFTWQPERGPARLGSVHLPSFPAWENVQSAEWTPPGSGRRLTFTLHVETPLVVPEGRWRLGLPERHRLKLELDDGERRVIEPGAVVAVGGGRLRYEGLGTWMGYQVFADWTLPWMLAACVVAVLSLAGHFWRRLFARPWQEPA